MLNYQREKVTDKNNDIIDMSDIGGGKIDCFRQNCSSEGFEIFLECYDFATGKCTCAIMDPVRARKLAVLLTELANASEEENKCPFSS